MKTVFISKLKPFLDAVAGETELYVPKKAGEHYVFSRYGPEGKHPVGFNSIRTCVPVKEFLFPMREVAAVYPEPAEPEDIKPFAVFGLKDCDLRSLEILDKVFMDADFVDPLYVSRRQKMLVISSDCTEAGKSCFCNVFGGKSYATEGFDLNVSKTRDGFIIEAGSQKGQDFIEKHSGLFSDAPEALILERGENRAQVQSRLEENNADLQFDGSTIREAVENGRDSEVFDIEAKNCVECQACTRVCPTCHCYYLYDTKQKDYFAKMKMWDSCMRCGYAAVAGGANPRKILGDRMKHRLLHKFVYFLDRYGINMCVGCGRCVDADAGGMDLREILGKLSQEPKDKTKKQAEVAK